MLMLHSRERALVIIHHKTKPMTDLITSWSKLTKLSLSPALSCCTMKFSVSFSRGRWSFMLALLSMAAQMVTGARLCSPSTELGLEAVRRAMTFTSLLVAGIFMQSPKTSRDREGGDGTPSLSACVGLSPPPILAC